MLLADSLFEYAKNPEVGPTAPMAMLLPFSQIA